MAVKTQRAPTVFPLKGVDSVSVGGEGVLEGNMMGELKDSWDAYCALPSGCLDPDKDRLPATLSDLRSYLEVVKAATAQRRETLERHFTDAFHSLPCAVSTAAMEVRFLRLSHQIPSTVNRSDLLRMAFDEAYLREFYPFLTKESRRNINRDILLWMEHCVLEDKLERLLSLCRPDSEQLFVKELEVYRMWEAEDHPRWLVFEVEGRLQIRPKQFIVANAILNNPGAIVQLKMGEGKTRVIIPMIIMQLTSSTITMETWSIPRIHFLTALLQEGHAHLHEFLTASVLNVKLFCLPFNRDVDLDMCKVNALHNALATCREERGVVVLAPEHRLSLQLKRFDLMTANEAEDSEAVSDRLLRLEGGFFVWISSMRATRFCVTNTTSSTLLAITWASRLARIAGLCARHYSWLSN
jgi:hypothetical protein